MGGGGANATIADLKGSKDCSNTSNVFSSTKNNVVFINYLTLGRSGGMLPQENFLTLQPLRPFLVASEHPVGEKPVSDILHFNSQMLDGGCVFSRA